jgi:four helix bundle suffix protein
MTRARGAEPLIPPHGGYRDLKPYQMAEIVFDATMVFCDRFIDKRSRTHDQMIQAARSGKQNIAQGRMASGISYKTYFEKADPEIAANTAISLIHQTNYLLDQQLRALEKTFLEEGGFTERLYRVRSQTRGPWKKT